MFLAAPTAPRLFRVTLAAALVLRSTHTHFRGSCVFPTGSVPCAMPVLLCPLLDPAGLEFTTRVSDSDTDVCQSTAAITIRPTDSGGAELDWTVREFVRVGIRRPAAAFCGRFGFRFDSCAAHHHSPSRSQQLAARNADTARRNRTASALDRRGLIGACLPAHPRCARLHVT